jgi:hypothetical protein
VGIEVQCSCGTQVRALDEMAGRSVRCPACQGLVRLPGKSAEQAGYGVEEVRKCPSCKHVWPADAVVCLDCGYNFETGRKMRTRYKVSDHAITVGITWLGFYSRYTIFRGKRGQPCLKVIHKILFFSAGSATYDLSQYRAAVTNYISGTRDDPEFYEVELEGPGKKTVKIYSGANEEKFKELLDVLSQVGRLEIKRK